MLVLPGVGAFGAAAERLAPGRDAMRAALGAGLPCLGICLGMQLLFDGSDESTPDVPGLGLIGGRVTRLQACRVPQIGWNSLDDTSDPLLEAAPLPYAYYANSYVCRPNDDAGRARLEHSRDRSVSPRSCGSAERSACSFTPRRARCPGCAFFTPSSRASRQ